MFSKMYSIRIRDYLITLYEALNLNRFMDYPIVLQNLLCISISNQFNGIFVFKKKSTNTRD